MFRYLYFQNPRFLFWLLPLAIWDLFWRGKALWRASKNNQVGWFIALLLVNSIGILPLIYLAFFAKKSKNKI
jgi:methionyl-tRNA synthetase